MTKTQKILFYLGVPVLVLLISFPFWPERYGDSYSEQQRKIWNEILALDSYGEPDYHDNREKLDQQIGIKRDFAAQLQDVSAPDWTVKPPSSPDLSKLPPDGMTFDELLHYAKTGKDPDAFLYFITSTPLDEFETGPIGYWGDFTPRTPKTWRFDFIRDCLRKAQQQNRPGTDFLLKVLDLEELRKLGSENPELQIENIPGYKDFTKRIDSGDFLLYKLLFTIAPYMDRLGLGEELEKTLEKKARQGDVTAQRQLGEYGFFHYQRQYEQMMWDTLSPRHPIILWIAEKTKPWRPDWLPIKERTDSSVTRNKLLKSASWLKKAADAGDLTAMNLWLTYGVETLTRIDKKTWNDIFKYNDLLIQAGYENGMFLNEFQRIRRGRSDDIIRLYYSVDSFDRVTEDNKKSLFARGAAYPVLCEINYTNWEEISPQTALDLIERVRRNNPSILIADGCGDIYPYFFYKIKDEKVRQRYIDIVRENANKGHPVFMVALHQILLEEPKKQHSPDEPVQLLEQAWPRLFTPDHSGNPSLRFPSYAPSYHLTEYIVDNLMETYLIDSPSSENKRKAFKLADEYFSRLGNHDYACFYLSLMYQKGYGTPRNSEKEAHYYEEFLKNSGMNNQEALKSLFEQFDYKIPQ